MISRSSPNKKLPKWEIVGEVSDLSTIEVSELPAELDSTSFQLETPRLAVPRLTPRVVLPQGFSIVPDSELTNEGIPLRITGGKAGVVMAYVQAGVFSGGDNYGPEDSRPQQNVFLNGFYMDLTEVTLEQYEKFREDLVQQKKQARAPANADASPSEPALGINWNEAMIFARWAGKELPTEAQWEKAARGPSGFNHPWGNGRSLCGAAPESPDRSTQWVRSKGTSVHLAFSILPATRENGVPTNTPTPLMRRSKPRAKRLSETRAVRMSHRSPITAFSEAILPIGSSGTGAANWPANACLTSGSAAS